MQLVFAGNVVVVTDYHTGHEATQWLSRVSKNRKRLKGILTVMPFRSPIPRTEVSTFEMN